MSRMVPTTKTRNANRGCAKTKNVPQVLINLEASPSSMPQPKLSRTETRSDTKGVSSFFEARAEIASNMSRRKEQDSGSRSNRGLMSPLIRGSYQPPSPKGRSRIIY